MPKYAKAAPSGAALACPKTIFTNQFKLSVIIKPSKRKEVFVMTCPECGSPDVSKVGHLVTGGPHGTDEYECNDCGHEFTVKRD